MIWKTERKVDFSLITSPPRESALRIQERARKFTNRYKSNYAKLYGKISNVYLQWEHDRGYDILVPTPRYITKFFSKSKIHFHKLCYNICNEVDRLMEYNFAKEVTNIL